MERDRLFIPFRDSLRPFERETRFELATPTLARLCSTDWATLAMRWRIICDYSFLLLNMLIKLTSQQEFHFRLNTIFERETRFEPATYSLEGCRSTDWATLAKWCITSAQLAVVAGIGRAHRIHQNLISCGGRIRTSDPKVMSLVSYLCSTPRYILPHQIGILLPAPRNRI